MTKCMYDGTKLLIEDAKLMYRPNFTGRGDKFNREGDRKFTVRIDDPELADRLKADGWNVKTRIRDDEEAINYIEVRVKYSGYKDPKCYLVTRRNGPILLDEETVSEFDTADIVHIDMTITPYEWNVNDKTGVSAYLKTIYVTIEEDEWADRYAEDENPVD